MWHGCGIQKDNTLTISDDNISSLEKIKYFTSKVTITYIVICNMF